jgi:hypothetical protein
VAAGSFFASRTALVAADPPKKASGAATNVAATDPAAAGRDFDAQGEYSGYVPGRQSSRRVGWQIIALGDGKFRAVEHTGGLPADGWDGRSKRQFDGAWQGRFVAFPDCGEHAALLVGREVWVRDREDGTLLGVLRKVHRQSPTLGARPPPGALVLFDGSSTGNRATDAFTGGRTTPDGLLMVGPTTRLAVRDFFLHLEFRTPFMPAARGQGRGNSGVYIQRRYEVQILDSFGLPGVDNECGGLYKQRAPALNMCLPPLAWQTYDIEFRAARFDAGKKTGAAQITVRHNGVTIHNRIELTNKTGGGQPEGPQPLPILLQDHGNPVHFRNVWLVEQ